MSFATDHFRQFAQYNRWANRRLYKAAAELPEADYLKPRQSFFKSLHGTLNHILVADRIWLARFTGHPNHGIKSLDQILYADLIGLTVAREAEDAQLVAFTDGLNDADLRQMVTYTNMAGQSHTRRLDHLLPHIFNHQTHHRGQAHDQLSQTNVAPPPLDLLYYLIEIGQ